MATGKFLDIRKTEKYMNDACFEAMSRLYKAARRKSDHVWGDKFDSLNSFFGDDDEQKTDNVYGTKSPVKKSSNISWRVLPAGDSGHTKNHRIHKNDDCGEETDDGNQKLEWRVIKADSIEKRGNNQIVNDSLCNYKRIPYQQSHSGLSMSEKTVANQERSSYCLPESVNRRKSMSVSIGDDFEYRSPNRSSEEAQTRVNPVENAVWREQNEKYVAGKNPLISRGHSQTRHPSRIIENTRHSSNETSPSSNPQKKYIRSSAKQEDNTFAFPDTFSEVRYQETAKNQSSGNSSPDKKMVSRSKRTRCDSDSSSDSQVPLQKKQLGSGEFRRESGSDISESDLETMLSVKIIQDTQWHEFIVSLSNFNRIRKKYPKLSEALPDIDDEEKEFHFCYDAIKTIFGFLFHRSCNYNTMPIGKIAVEILAAANSWSIGQFYSTFLKQFLKKITINNCAVIHSLAKYFGLLDICDACQAVVSDKTPLNKGLNERLVKPGKCLVLVSEYVEPAEYLIPLKSAIEVFGDFFDKDIRNTIVFEAVSSDFVITGFGIRLDANSSNEESTTLDIFYTVKTIDGILESEEMKQNKPLRSNIVIHFKTKRNLKVGQKLQISVEITVKPSMCFTSTKEMFEEKTSGVEFRVHMDSTYKVRNSDGKRFFIEKLLYNTVDTKD